MNRKHIQYLCLAALFAALTTALTKVGVPVGNGVVHLGDAMIYLTGCLLPTPYAMAAAAVGGGLADMLSPFAMFAPATFIIKAAIAALFSAKQATLLSRRNAWMTLPAAAITVAGYYTAELLLYSADWRAIAATSIPANLAQALGSAALFFALAATLDKVRLKERLM